MFARTIAPNASSFLKAPEFANTPAIKSPFPPLSSTTVTELHHLSWIEYEVPSARVFPLIPQTLVDAGFCLKLENGQAKFVVMSYVDQPLNFLSSVPHEGFEQTNYWLKLERDEQTFYWQINAVLGSLTAVSARNLWQTPWHLGATEFQYRFDELQQLYLTYRLQSQCEGLNASFQLADTGELYAFGNADFALPGKIDECFVRNDGSIGMRKLSLRCNEYSQAKITSARCELAARLSLLDAQELSLPVLAALSRSASLEIEPITILTQHLTQQTKRTGH